MPLKEVFKRISAKENGKSALSHKEPTEKILAYFEEIVPEYDKERVYVSDMKKNHSVVQPAHREGNAGPG